MLIKWLRLVLHDDESDWLMFISSGVCIMCICNARLEAAFFVEPLDFVIPANYSIGANWSGHSQLMVCSKDNAPLSMNGLGIKTFTLKLIHP